MIYKRKKLLIVI